MNGTRPVIIHSMCFLLSVAATHGATYKTLYVTPDGKPGVSCERTTEPGNLVRAQALVRELAPDMKGDIVVILKDGIYDLSGGCLTFTEADSGRNGHRVIWRAENRGKSVLSGGVDLSGGWSLHDRTNNIHRKIGVDGRFRQLYVNGQRTVRARKPNMTDESTRGPYYSGKNNNYPFTVNASDLGDWADDGGMEFVWVGCWSQMRGRIASCQNGTIVFAEPEKSNKLVNHHNQNPTFFFLENHYALLDAEGEWFLDPGAKVLYYKPRAGEDMTKAAVIAPKADSLVSFHGVSRSNLVSNIEIRDLTFRHSNWTGPNDHGLIDCQAAFGYQGEDGLKYMPGMVELCNVEGIRIVGNVLELGGGVGIRSDCGGRTQNTLVCGNVVKDMAGGGIYFGMPVGHDSHHDAIRNNLVMRIGRDYAGSVGIAVGKVSDIAIEHNEIRQVPYTGISIGWDWSDKNNDCNNNIIGNNRIHEYMQLLCDGAGVYSLGRQDGHRIHHNYVYNAVTSPWAGHPWATSVGELGQVLVNGIYLDNGSCNKTVEYNVIDTGKHASTFSAANPPNHDNVFRFNYHLTEISGVAAQNRVESNNVRVTTGTWPAEALSIMDDAGIEDAWQYIDAAVDPRTRNMAAGALATASSIAGEACSAGNANDNNLIKGLWACDGKTPAPWWQVDLGAPCRVHQVDVLARQDMDQDFARANFKVWGSNDPEFKTREELAVQGDVAFAAKKMRHFVVSGTGAYRYVRVGRDGQGGHLNFAEVRVMARPTK